MVKILSRSGDSLADMYDVEGSIAGIDQLVTAELPIVHEMGATIFSERAGGNIRRIATGDILQSVSWNLTLTAVGRNIGRLLGIAVFTDAVARVNISTLSLRDVANEREVPIFAWDNNEASVVALMQDNGAAVAEFDLLQSVDVGGKVPSMLLGAQQSPRMDEIVFRGSTAAFGAGTVEVVALVNVMFAEFGGVSSRGLPIPGW